MFPMGIVPLLVATVLVIPGSEGFVPTPCAHRCSSSTGRRGCNAWPGPTRMSKLDASAGDSSTPSSSGVNGATCTCRNCKKQFRRDENEAGACSFHPGLFSGRLNRVNDVDTSGLEYFWSCCGEGDKSHAGCANGQHASYDDPPEGGEGGWRSPLTGTLRSSP